MFIFFNSFDYEYAFITTKLFNDYKQILDCTYIIFAFVIFVYFENLFKIVA